MTPNNNNNSYHITIKPSPKDEQSRHLAYNLGLKTFENTNDELSYEYTSGRAIENTRDSITNTRESTYNAKEKF